MVSNPHTQPGIFCDYWLLKYCRVIWKRCWNHAGRVSDYRPAQLLWMISDESVESAPPNLRWQNRCTSGMAFSISHCERDKRGRLRILLKNKSYLEDQMTMRSVSQGILDPWEWSLDTNPIKRPAEEALKVSYETSKRCSAIDHWHPCNAGDLPGLQAALARRTSSSLRLGIVQHAGWTAVPACYRNKRCCVACQE